VSEKIVSIPVPYSEPKVTVVTHCDSNYLSRVLSLILSLQNNGFTEQIVVFTHDEQSFEKLSALSISNLQTHMISDLEEQFPELIAARNNRPIIEFYYCITPFLLKYIQVNFRSTLSVYLDADLYFFQPIREVLAGMDKSVIAITPHRFTNANSNLEKYGLFNVGLVCFGTGDAAAKVLEWWTNRCLESTSQELSNGVYGDQKYLDRFEEISPGVKILNDPGINAAPWNLNASGSSDGRVWVDSGSGKSDLIFFHFSGLKRFRFLKLLGFMPFRHRPSKSTKALIYYPYLISLHQSELKLGISSYDSTEMPSLLNSINYLRYGDFILKHLPRKNLRHQ
jgi:hypothetical protein